MFYPIELTPQDIFQWPNDQFREENKLVYLAPEDGYCMIEIRIEVIIQRFGEWE